MPTIRIAAAVATDAAGRHLLVRKRGTTEFIQAGGKLEPGESPRDALRRELAEELGLTVAGDALEYLGRFTAPAVHQPGSDVSAEVFRLTAPVPEPLVPAAEIAEVAWVDPAAPGRPLAPLSALLVG